MANCVEKERLPTGRHVSRKALEVKSFPYLRDPLSLNGNCFHQMEKEQNYFLWRLTKNDLISIGRLFHPDLMIKPHKPFVNVFDAHKLTPLLHKDVVESTACPHQKAVSTFLPPAQRASWPGGRITSPVE